MRRLSPDLTKIQQLQLTQYTFTENVDFSYMYISGKITIIPKPELSAFWGDSLTQRHFWVTSAEVVIICPVATVGHPRFVSK